MIQKPMSFEYEPSSKPLHISAWSFLNRWGWWQVAVAYAFALLIFKRIGVLPDLDL